MAVRVDKWLWAVRVFPTRTAAAKACDDGQVTIDDRPAKPATRVGPGDVVTARRRDRVVVYVVVEPIEKRVSAARASACYEDRSPPPAPRSDHVATVFARRDRGAGRPTKRDRREIERLRGRGDTDPR